MYHLVQALRPQLTLEIGTYFAGTTEVIARALCANGSGGLLTIDPFGAERVPAILQTWPKDLSDSVSFMTMNSMEIFMAFDHLKRILDFSFADGNHAYTYAF